MFYGAFYDTTVRPNEMKINQDCFIIKFTEATKPVRSRPVNDLKGDKAMTIKYFIYNKLKKEKIPVCQKAYLNTLRLTKCRVIGVVKRHFENGQSPREKRGGDRKLKVYESKRNSVIRFVKKFQVIENHYCRSKTQNRQYLESDLNIKKMWLMYNTQSEEELKVKQCFFRHVFRTKFNIGFGSPRTDECSTCISFHEQIKHSHDPQEKQNMMAAQRCHKLKAKSFYNMLKEKRENLLTFSFDCQKNQVLPRVPDQSAYYSRQLYKYNVTIVVGDSKAKQNKENVFIYDYDESQHKKGSNEISSVVYDFLTNLKVPPTVTTIRAMSDGCGGQNKNTTMMGMLSYWLQNNAPATVQKIEFIFPVVGHSFLPPDRVFARIEKEIKHSNVIINPHDYSVIFEKFGTVRSVVGKVYDWKSRCCEIFKPPSNWHFHFNLTKRFIFKKNTKSDNVLINGEANYRNNLGKFQNVCKRGTKVSYMAFPDAIKTGVPIAPLKIRDVKNLLTKHFGNNWPQLESLIYFKNIVENISVESEGADVENKECDEFYDEVPNLIV